MIGRVSSHIIIDKVFSHCLLIIKIIRRTKSRNRSSKSVQKNNSNRDKSSVKDNKNKIKNLNKSNKNNG